MTKEDLIKIIRQKVGTDINVLELADLIYPRIVSTWNDAVEEAAIVAQEAGGGEYNDAAVVVRRLKRPGNAPGLGNRVQLLVRENSHLERTMRAFVSSLQAVQTLIQQTVDTGQRAFSPPRWRHLKRGTTYVELGEAKLQRATDAPLPEGTAITFYCSEEGELHCRASQEFHDGRFAKEDR